MHRVGYSAVKSPECVKKSKIAYKFFITKAADQKTIFFNSPWKMGVETCVTIWYLFKKKKNVTFFLHFFVGIFFNPP